MLLAIDTANKYLSLALSTPNGDFYFSSNQANLQLEIISQEVDLLCKESGFSISNLTEVVVNRGIGSFNGIRVGVSYAIGLSSFSSISLKTITTHDILYHGGVLKGNLKLGTDYKIITKGDGLNKFCVGRFSSESMSIEDFENLELSDIDGKFIVADSDIADSFTSNAFENVVYVKKNSPEFLLMAAKNSAVMDPVVNAFYFRGFL